MPPILYYKSTEKNVPLHIALWIFAPWCFNIRRKTQRPNGPVFDRHSFNLRQMTLNIAGQLFSLEHPQVMGILNITPDSFYAGSRKQTEADIANRAIEVATEGGTMIDLGAYSSRSGAVDVSPAEEMARLRKALQIVRKETPQLVVSVDTFRAEVAKMAVEEEGAHIINDIAGGDLDPAMFDTVAQLRVPYILMHMKGTPQTMQQSPVYDHLIPEVLQHLAERVQRLQRLGARDIILDPGFGFAKTLAHNYQLMAHLEAFGELELPLLVGISRKSMIYRLLDGTPETALNGTTALHMVALQKGAHILRVHDVAPACEAVAIHRALTDNRLSPACSSL